MLELISLIIEQLNGAVVTLAVILITVIYGTYKMGGAIKSFKSLQEKNETTDTKLDKMNDNISEIKATTKLLYDAHLQTVRGQSPLRLTELGQEITKEVSIPEKIDKHWDDIKTKLKEADSDNPYDIQTKALDIANDCFDYIFTESEKEQVKTIAFKKGINLRQIYPIIGIEIRDRVFKERGINLEEVDKHAAPGK